MSELRQYKNDSIWSKDTCISFDFAALFHSPIRVVKKGGNFKINLLMDQMGSSLFCLCSKEKANVPYLQDGFTSKWT